MNNKKISTKKIINLFPGDRDSYCLPFKDYPT